MNFARGAIRDFDPAEGEKLDLGARPPAIAGNGGSALNAIDQGNRVRREGPGRQASAGDFQLTGFATA